MALVPASTDPNRKKQLDQRAKGEGNWNNAGAPARTPAQQRRAAGSSTKSK